MLEAQAEAASMKDDLLNLTRERNAAVLEAKTGREELKKVRVHPPTTLIPDYKDRFTTFHPSQARKEWIKMKDDLVSEREAFRALKDDHDKLTTLYKHHVQDLNGSQARLQHSLDEARQEIDRRVPVEAIQGIKDQLEETSSDLVAKMARVAELEEEVAQLRKGAGMMTPRPSWEEFEQFGILVS